MNLIKECTKPLKLQLTRDLSRQIKSGHPWVFKDALEKISENASPGNMAILLDKNRQFIAKGFYNGKGNLAFRSCLIGNETLDNAWINQLLKKAVERREHFFKLPETNCFRLINGEGDQLPGLICDLYNNCLVIQFDGEGSRNFWNEQGLAQWFLKHLPTKLDFIYLKYKSSKNRAEMTDKGMSLYGEAPPLIKIKENGIQFLVNVVDGAKTGFFLDQRNNRNLLSHYCQNKSVLNLFGYTGGFSLYAGRAKAKEVYTVDLAPEAIKASEANWLLNELPATHTAICQDVFEFLEQQKKSKKNWDVIVVDPPSFAPSQQDIHSAKNAYTKLLEASCRLINKNGILVASSCSGHIGVELFYQIASEAISKANRRGTLLEMRGQPSDHPFPLNCQELQYLKFLLIEIN